MLLRLHIPKKVKKWKPIAFAQQIPWRNQRKSLEEGAKLPVEAKCFHHKFHFGRTSQMLVAELRKDASKPFGHGISWANRHFQTFFPGMVKNDRFACTKYRFNYFELAH